MQSQAQFALHCLSDGIDVVLRRIRGSSTWKWIFHGLGPIAALIISLVFFHDQ